MLSWGTIEQWRGARVGKTFAFSTWGGVYLQDKFKIYFVMDKNELYHRLKNDFGRDAFILINHLTSRYNLQYDHANQLLKELFEEDLLIFCPRSTSRLEGYKLK